ncbi:hypothetical protein BJX99DRAFT_44975 [Aspergillus californicus]
MLMATWDCFFICNLFAEGKELEERALDEALLFKIQSNRPKTSCPLPGGKGLWVSPMLEKIAPCTLLQGYRMKPIEALDPTYKSCWLALFPSGFITDCKLERPCGKGLRTSFPKLVSMTDCEYDHLQDNKITSLVGTEKRLVPHPAAVQYVLEGKTCTLTPVAYRENSSDIQWHFERRKELRKVNKFGLPKICLAEYEVDLPGCAYSYVGCSQVS